MVNPTIKWTLEQDAVSGQVQDLPLQDIYLFLGSFIKEDSAHHGLLR